LSGQPGARVLQPGIIRFFPFLGSQLDLAGASI
jgi:hypothetical protein